MILFKFCSECGTPNEIDAFYCSECGFKLDFDENPIVNNKMTLNDFKNDLFEGKVSLPKENSPWILNDDEKLILFIQNIVLKESDDFINKSNIDENVVFTGAKSIYDYALNDNLSKIAKGYFILTNNRIIFRGRKKHLEIYLDDITSIYDYQEGIGIKHSNNDKLLFLLGTNESSVSFSINGEGYKFYLTGDVVKISILGQIYK